MSRQSEYRFIPVESQNGFDRNLVVKQPFGFPAQTPWYDIAVALKQQMETDSGKTYFEQQSGNRLQIFYPYSIEMLMDGTVNVINILLDLNRQGMPVSHLFVLDKSARLGSYSKLKTKCQI